MRKRYISNSELNKGKNNYIIAELNVDINEKNIRIINSYEEYYKKNKFFEYNKEYENEKEIKENCEIFIDNELIPFSYFHEFEKEGKYTIKYIFKNKIKKANHLFEGCSSLTNIDLSNFISNDIIDISYMFDGCFSLKNINLSNFNTNNVKNMSYVFFS